MRSQQSQAVRNVQLARLLRLIRDLDRVDGLDVYEMAERCRTTVRTIWRDLQALQDVGLPLTTEQDGKRTRWRITYRDKLANIASLLDASHYLALRVAMGSPSPVGRESAVFTALEDLAEKVERAVGPAERKRLEAIERCFFQWEKRAYHETGKDLLWPLVEAIEGCRICRVSYRSPHAKAPKTIEVLPLRVFVHDQALYVLADFRTHGAVGMLNLHRVQTIEVTRRTGTPPKSFDPDAWEAAAFDIFVGGKPTKYVFRFAPEVAPFIRERQWHPSQKLRALRGGGVQLTMTCAESHEIQNWVASWRQWVEVVEPKSLRQEMAELGTWMVKAYG